MIEQFAFSIVAGLIVGIFSGLLGIGGGTLMIPLFRLGFGLSAIVSTATSLFTIVPLVRVASRTLRIRRALRRSA